MQFVFYKYHFGIIEHLHEMFKEVSEYFKTNEGSIYRKYSDPKALGYDAKITLIEPQK